MNHRHVLPALKLALAAIAMVAIGASQAHALDSKIYSGLLCVNYGSAGIANYEYGAIGNYSSTDVLRVGCPIVRRDGTLMYSGYVQVFNPSEAQGVACRIVAGSVDEDENRLTGAFSPYQNSVGVGGTKLFFGDPGGADLSHYYYFCQIPPMTSEGASHVVLYRVTEINVIE